MVLEVANYYLKKGTPIVCTLFDCSKAFDKCKFSVLFQKLLDRKVPPIVIRVLIFIYEEPEGCVRLAGVLSSSFRITNGTRQGSVLSPTLFSLYLNDLLETLRMKGLGCHVAGVWVGAAGYADDLFLLAPTRETMSRMLKVCANCAAIHNLVFSTDVNPFKSKTKCIFMNGKKGNELPNGVPKPLELYWKNLPWVPYATHLGHELHQSCTMEFDCRIKRAKFIDSSLEIRDTFSFAHPNQILTAVQMYSLHCYGSMLWDFGDESMGKFCRSWTTCVKLCNRVTRSTHTYFVENL